MDEKEQKIKDIPSLKKLSDDAENLTTLKATWPLFRPLLKLLGANVDAIDESLGQVEQLTNKAKKHINIPDEFDDIFSESGWILYSQMNMEVAKEAVSLAKNGQFTQAENLLVDYFSVDQIQRELNAMIAVKAFQNRMPLAEKALVDFREGRYYSSVLLVLSLLDGMVNEIQHRGFFSSNVDLTAWDSIAAHSKGLQKLQKIFYKGRNKTTTEEIFLPYRNGILHGMDLGYDNCIVATKSWVALFATKDWALKAERGELEAPPAEKEKTLGEVIQQLQAIEQDKKTLANWKPRDIIIGQDVPQSGKPDQYENKTPEQKLTEYLYYWAENNYGYMRNCLSLHLSPPSLVSPKDIREIYQDKKLKQWKIFSIKDEMPYITIISVELTYENNGESIIKSIEARMMYEDNKSFGVIPEKPDGRWFIVNYHLV